MRLTQVKTLWWNRTPNLYKWSWEFLSIETFNFQELHSEPDSYSERVDQMSVGTPSLQRRRDTLAVSIDYILLLRQYSSKGWRCWFKYEVLSTFCKALLKTECLGTALLSVAKYRVGSSPGSWNCLFERCCILMWCVSV